MVDYSTDRIILYRFAVILFRPTRDAVRREGSRVVHKTTAASAGCVFIMIVKLRSYLGEHFPRVRERRWSIEAARRYSTSTTAGKQTKRPDFRHYDAYD